MTIRTHITVRGIVQGVGFRPFVFSQATRNSLNGLVLNNTNGVLIDVEGESSAISRLVEEIRLNPPPRSIVESVECADLPLAHFNSFRIVESDAAGQRFVPISADIATCAECVSELFNPQDRRYRYPFINCTNCGPRFTIVEGVPYDREQTTMRDFVMCPECRAEYDDPKDRRFHAEPIACHRCGPELSLFEANGRKVYTQDPIEETRFLLLAGKIIAIKGIGGFHLACDAMNNDAVSTLRQRKYREDKPFALMTASFDTIRRHCKLSREEEALLLSERRPIVLLERIASSGIADEVAPKVKTFGFMLAYTPLQHLLFASDDLVLVMTSANVSDEPIAYEDDEAFARLREIADYFLTHNRRINVRSDDSVARVRSGCEMVLRRSRGYAPAPIKTTFEFKKNILACGAELKNTFCIAHNNYAFVSHHIGDLENLETLQSFTNGIEHFKRLFSIEPDVIAYDLHPEYLSTKHALSLDDELTKVGIQHHHAHIASCMVDNNIEGEVIGVAMDGLGFGADGRLWGGEFFVADIFESQRFAHLDYVPMPGGVRAVREPWRMAAAYLHRTFGDSFLDLTLDYSRELDRSKWKTLRGMMNRSQNSPETSSMGRLFDAVASLLRVRDFVNYEGQAAIELEQIADPHCETAYQFQYEENGVIKAESLIREACEDLVIGVPPETISARFHNSVANLILAVAQTIRISHQLNRVVLSGGVFQNMLLLKRASDSLSRDGFQVFTHKRVPPNDGGISLGQAAIANAQISRRI